MPPRRAPPKNRPPTLKEARRAYLKRGGSSYMSEAERQRLIRAQEREERRVERLKKEAARQEASKKRAELAAQQRDQRRRLGLPDPNVKIGAGQLRIGAFLRGKKMLERNENEVENEGKSMKTEDNEDEGESEGEVRLREETVDKLEDRAVPDESDLEEHQEDEHENFGSDVDDEEVLALGAAQECLLPPPTTPEKRHPIILAAELRSSFFESNSQIEREVNETVPTSPIAHVFEERTPRGCTADAVTTPKAATADRLPPIADIKTPERSEIESILFAISSQELNYLSSSPPIHGPARTTR